MFVLSEKITKIIKGVLSLVAIVVISKLLYTKQLDLSSLFKIYFMVAGIFFIYTQFRRYSMAEFLSLTGLLSAIFFLLSFRLKLIVFSSFVLMIVSFFTFMITRFRPDKSTITFVYFTLIFSLLYRLSPFLALIGILIILLMFLFRSKDGSIDSLIIIFLIPAIFYLIILGLGSKGTAIEFNTTIIRVISLTTMVFTSFFFMSRLFHQKISCSYSMFYISHILFAISINTIHSTIIALLMIFTLPFIYSSKVSKFSVFNLVMLPPSPLFILKLGLFAITLSMGHIADYLLMLLTYLIVIFHTFRYFYINEAEKKPPLLLTQKILGAVSFLIILVCLIYLNTIKNIISSALINITG